MTWPTPASLEDALIGAHLRYQLVPGWDDRTLSPYDPGDVSCDYGILHHTAGTDSLTWMAGGNQYAPVRACHFLVNRDGSVDVVTAWPCYHAGAGGPGAWGGGPLIGQDVMNQHAYGIEIESKGTSLEPVNGDGYTPVQVATTAALAAAICHMNGWAPGRWVNHKTWAPNRKQDTLWPDARWHGLIGTALALARVPPPTPIGGHTMLIRRSSNGWVTLLANGKHVGVSGTSYPHYKGILPEVTLDEQAFTRLIAAFPLTGPSI